MSAEQNKAITHRWIEEVINQQNLALIDELFTSDYVNHMAPPGFPTGPQGEKLFTQMFFGAFPNGRMELVDVVAEGDRAAGRYTFSGTHTGEFIGIPPTGKRFSVSGINIIRFANGKIAENWPSLDMLGLMQQIGVVPAPGQ